MARTVAVTGATGFIGSHLVRRLGAEGWRIRILARRLPVHPHFGGTPVDVVIGTLEDGDSLRELVRGVDAVVHAAGLIKARSRKEFFEANATGVARLAEAAADEPAPPRLILLSSLAARHADLSVYGASKHAGEMALSARPDLRWTIFRPPAVYGPGDRETLAFFRCVARGVGPLLGSEDTRLSLVHVEDVAAAVALQASDAEDAGSVYEIDDGRPGGYSWREMVAAAAESLGTRPRTVRVPRPVLQGVALANGLRCRLSGRPPMLTPDKVREICHTDWVCHDHRFRTRTGWRPAFTLPQGFSGTIAWYRERGWL